MSKIQQFGSTIKNNSSRFIKGVGSGVQSFGQGLATGYNYVRNPITRAGVAPIRSNAVSVLNDNGINSTAYRAGISLGKFSASSFNSLAHFVKVTIPQGAVKLGKYLIQLGNKIFQAVRNNGQFMWKLISTNAKRFLQQIGKTGSYIGKAANKIVSNVNTGIAEALIPENKPVQPRSNRARHIKKAQQINAKNIAARNAAVEKAANRLYRAELTGATLGAGSLVYGLLTHSKRQKSNEEDQ